MEGLRLGFISFFFLYLSNFAHCEVNGGNLGHRVGAGKGEYHKHLPENSLEALKAALLGSFGGGRGTLPIQFFSAFRYLEFDIQETADGELVLFHDKKLSRMLPNQGSNSQVYLKVLERLRKQGRRGVNTKDLKIKDLTIRELSALNLQGNLYWKIARLEDFLSASLVWGLKRPIAVDIKYLQTDRAKRNLIEVLGQYREDLNNRNELQFSNKYDLDPSGVSFLAFPSRFSEAFGERRTQLRRKWCALFRENGHRKIYRAAFHSKDLCQDDL